MFGIYSNKRLTEKERKILYMEPDDCNWYSVVLVSAFGDNRIFQVREDIELPQNEDDDGVVLMMDGGNIIYFRTVEDDLNEDVYSSIIGVCSFLKETFHCDNIDAYVLCKPNMDVCFSSENCEDGVRIFFASFAAHDGESIIEWLESKLDNHEQFNISDSIDHMLLPFSGYKNKEKFQENYNRYMDKINAFDV